MNRAGLFSIPSGIVCTGLVLSMVACGAGPFDCDDQISVPSLEVNSKYCWVQRLGGERAMAMVLDGTELLTLESDASKATPVVSRRDLADSKDRLAAGNQIFQAVARNDPGAVLSRFIARHSKDSRLAIGYGSPGDLSKGVVLVTRSNAEAIEIKAPGNYDAAFLDSGGLLISGHGIGTQKGGNGVYFSAGGKHQLLIDNLGESSGFVAVGDEIVFAGGCEGTNHIWAFLAQELVSSLASGKTVSAASSGVPIYRGPALDVAAYGHDIVIVDGDHDTSQNLLRISTAVREARVAKLAEIEIITRQPEGKAWIDAIAASDQIIAVQVIEGDRSEILLLKEK